MAKHEVTLTMIFDDNGNLAAVKPTGDAEAENLGGPGEPFHVKTLREGHDKLNFHAFIYEFGSPGSVIYQTQAGPIRIWWPQ